MTDEAKEIRDWKPTRVEDLPLAARTIQDLGRQVAALKRSLDLARHEAKTAVEERDELALEVQQSRGRRCENCLHWKDIHAASTDHTRKDMGFCQEGHETYAGWVPKTWFCADFTPKEKEPEK
jgi:hypothetical protein